MGFNSAFKGLSSYSDCIASECNKYNLFLEILNLGLLLGVLKSQVRKQFLCL